MKEVKRLTESLRGQLKNRAMINEETGKKLNDDLKEIKEFDNFRKEHPDMFVYVEDSNK